MSIDVVEDFEPINEEKTGIVHLSISKTLILSSLYQYVASEISKDMEFTKLQHHSHLSIKGGGEQDLY